MCTGGTRSPKWPPGDPNWPTGSGKMAIPRFLGISDNFCQISFMRKDDDRGKRGKRGK